MSLSRQYGWMVSAVLLMCMAASGYAETVAELQTAYSGTTTWNAGTGTLTFTGTGTIDFVGKANYKNHYWDVPGNVQRIVINENVTVTGAFHTYANCTIEGVNRHTSIVYGTPLQKWADQNNPGGVDLDEWNYCQFQNWGGVLTIKNLTALNPFSYFVRGWGKVNHVQSCDFIDDRGGWSNHSDGFSGGHGSTVDNCYFETGDDAIKCYFDITVTNTTIKMIQNCVPFQFGWGTYQNSHSVLSNITIIGDWGRGSSCPVFQWVSGSDYKSVVMDNCSIENPNATLFELFSAGTLDLEANASLIHVYTHGTSSFPGTRTICETTEPLANYDCGYGDIHLYYALDVNLLDLTGNGNDGCYYGGGFADSLLDYGQCLVLDGADDYIDVPQYRGVTGSAPRTCAMWIKTLDSQADLIGWGRVFDQNNQVVSGQKWQFSIFGNELGVLVQGGNIFCDAANLTDGRWHHVAVALEDTNGDSQLDISEAVLYIDGLAQPISRTAPYEVNTGALTDVTIGKSPFGSTGYFQGRMDEVRIYGYALSEQEVAQLAAVPVPAFDLVPDQVIDLADVSALLEEWLQTDCFESAFCNGRDLNIDQVVNQGDLAVLSAFWLSSPSPWSNQDIGTPIPGSMTEDQGVFTIESDGNDIWNTEDNFHFVYQSLEGDGTITARVLSHENTHHFSLAGVMIRETLDADSKHALMALRPVAGSSFRWRVNTGGTTGQTYPSDGAVAPYWVRLTRAGDTFTGEVSPDGNTWTPIESKTISMSSAAYVGMAVCSHDGTTLCTAVMDQIDINE